MSEIIPPGYGRLVGRVISAVTVEEGPVPLAGARVTFRPSVLRVTRDGDPTPLVVGSPVECALDEEGFLLGPDGGRGVLLVATDADTRPAGWHWVVRVQVPSVTSYQWQVLIPEGVTTDMVAATSDPAASGLPLLEWRGILSEVWEARADVMSAVGVVDQDRQWAMAARAGAERAAGRAEAAADAADAHADSANESQVLAADAKRDAETAADAATVAASDAALARGAAVAARGDAELFAGHAEASAGDAADSAQAAADSALGAAGSASTAEHAVGLAAQHAGDAETARDGAVTAKTLAEEARDGATQSTTSASASASQATAAAASTAFHGQIQWDEVAGRYTNESLAAFFAARTTVQPYGVRIPKGLATGCDKTGANMGIPNPTPSTLATPGSDPYIGHSPFTHIEVNGGVENDGTPYVTAVRGDKRFKRDGSNGDVWIMTPILFWDFVDEGDDMHLQVSDTPLAGFAPQPKAFLPDGSRRPYALYAKYPLSQVDGTARSVSGQPTLIRAVSHNALRTICKNSATGYSGKSFADDWYLKIVFLLKYATKNSQSIYSGASSYDVYGDAVAAGTNTNQITVASSVGSKVLPLSWISLGTNLPASTNRGDTRTYNVFDARRVESVEDIGGGQTVITVDGPPFNVEAGNRIFTMPWGGGSCDSLTSDGAPYNPLSSREPFMVQGIEMMHGAYEILGDVILASTGDGWRPHTLLDSRNASTAVTADYADTGVEIPSTDSTWQYSVYPSSAGGLLFGDGLGAASSTGMADGTYINPVTTVGTRQWPSLGYLTVGTPAGLWFLLGNGSLGHSYWYFASRLSAMGRGGEAA